MGLSFGDGCACGCLRATSALPYVLPPFLPGKADVPVATVPIPAPRPAATGLGVANFALAAEQPRDPHHRAKVATRPDRRS